MQEWFFVYLTLIRFFLDFFFFSSNFVLNIDFSAVQLGSEQTNLRAPFPFLTGKTFHKNPSIFGYPIAEWKLSNPTKQGSTSITSSFVVCELIRLDGSSFELTDVLENASIDGFDDEVIPVVRTTFCLPDGNTSCLTDETTSGLPDETTFGLTDEITVGLENGATGDLAGEETVGLVVAITGGLDDESTVGLVNEAMVGFADVETVGLTEGETVGPAEGAALGLDETFENLYDNLDVEEMNLFFD